MCVLTNVAIADAEGNGDSISQAVQAERIALLTNVLNQVEPPLPRRASLPSQNANGYAPVPVGAPMQVQPMHPLAVAPRSNSRSRSQADTHAPFPTDARETHPIYQTPVYSPRGMSPVSLERVASPTSVFLPSCLQDVIQTSPPESSPATSSSSADLSFEEYDLGFSLADGYEYPVATARKADARGYDSAAPTAAQSIWKLDGEESKALQMPKAAPSSEVLELTGRMATLITV